jgi:Protein of unknown function (DUF4242)
LRIDTSVSEEFRTIHRRFQDLSVHPDQSDLCPAGGCEREETDMPRYLVERAFDDGLNIPVNDDGAGICLGVVGRNAEDTVTWVHSYVTPDRKRTFCIYDAPTPAAIHKAAAKNALPVSQITEVRVLDPYFYH